MLESCRLVAAVRDSLACYLFLLLALMSPLPAIHFGSSSLLALIAFGSSINRHNKNQEQQQTAKARGELDGGSKCSLKYLEGRMREMNVDWNVLWRQIILVCLKTLYCVQDVIPHNINSFELFGFDVLIDAGFSLRLCCACVLVCRFSQLSAHTAALRMSPVWVTCVEKALNHCR